MKVIVVKLVTLLSIQACNGQGYFAINQPQYGQIQAIEKNFKSDYRTVKTPIFLDNDFYPQADDLSPYPLIFIRKDSKPSPVKDLEVVYFFTEKDSSINLITYTWDKRKIGDNRSDNNVDHSQKLDQYSSKYEDIKNDLIKLVGEPTTLDNQLKKVKETDYGEWMEKLAIWKNSDTTIQLKLIFTQGKKRYGTHKIRVSIYW